MARKSAFRVPTKVLIAQGEATAFAMKLADNAEALGRLEKEGLPKNLAERIEASTQALISAEVEQERAKAQSLRQRKFDRALADQGFLWVKRLHARGRMYLATQGSDTIDMAEQLRFGQTKNKNVRGAVYALRDLVPEAGEQQAVLALDDAFLTEGAETLRKLGVSMKATALALKNQQAITAQVRAGDVALSQLLDQVRIADEAASLAAPQGQATFPLTIVFTELARIRAAAARKKAAVTDLEDTGS